MDDILLEGHLTAADGAQDPFPLLPFTVPQGIGRLHICYEVNHAIGPDKAGWEEGNIIDIGLFDHRGADFDGQGFRGWNGATRREFTVGPTEATPGFIPGPIRPGTWHILLGLQQLSPDGCDYRIAIRLEPGESEGTMPLPCPFDPTPAADGPCWFRGDLHCHSHHSDGTAPLADLAAAARARGLDFLAITEHNTVSHLPFLRDLSTQAGAETSPLLLIPGMELTTYRGHANLWPVSGWFDFRCRQDEQLETVRRMARERGALFSINHPKDAGPPWQFGAFFEPDCIEVWGAPWFISNYQSLAVWDGLLREGRHVTAVGGSDKHQAPFTGELGWYELGVPTTWVWAEELSIPAIVEGLRAGRVFISEDAGGPRIELIAETGNQRTTMGGTLSVSAGGQVRLTCRVWDGAGCLLRLVSARRVLETEVSSDEFVHKWEIVADGDRYVRPEVIDPPEAPLEKEPAALTARALGNAVYLP